MVNNKSIKIAVIDSGISKDYVNNVDIINGIGFKTNVEEGTIEVSEEYFDDFGHGTQCVDIINNHTDNSEFYIIKVLDSNGSTSSKTLEMALEYLCSIEIDIINLSLSMNNKKNEKIESLINKLHEQGKIIVASVKNGELSSAPASYKNVIGVNSIFLDNEEEFEFDPNREIQFKGSVIPILAKVNNIEYKFFGGNSKATCIATAMIANQVSKYGKGNISNIMEELKKKSKYIRDSNFKRTLEFTMLKDYKDFQTYFNFNKIKEKFCNYLKVSDEKLLNKRLIEIKNDLNEANIIDLIRIIEGNENIKISMKKFSLKNFEWIYSLIKYAEENNEGGKYGEKVLL